mmetsp:Transcript_40173/g.128326  ORF Transcript_40173/g.128326 Transcript_40173/m.128326 type:complete len:80 (+) Transcript_40173:224-463(+)
MPTPWRRCRGMSKSCTGMLDDLVKCLEKTPCVQKDKKNLKECAKDGNIAKECLSVRNGYFLCKRGQLDMRKRIRGNQGY